MDLKTVKSAPLHMQKKKRVGRGTGSGLGKTCGRGMKGQKSRSGYSRSVNFEGGRMPLIRRIPKRGFNNKRFAATLAVVNVSKLNLFAAGSTVDLSALREAALVKGNWDGIKILGHGDLTVSLTVKAHKFSKTAVEKITLAGGTVELL